MYSLRHPPLGIYEKALPSAFSWEEKFRAAKLAGFDYMELSIDESEEKLARLDWGDRDVESLKAMMKKYDIFFPTICLSGHRKYPFGSKNPEVRKKAFIIMEKAIILAVRLGVRCIQLAAYDVYYEDSDETTKKLYLQGMQESVRMAAKAGVILALEIMDTPFNGTILRAMHYIRQIPSPYFKLYPDIGNLTQFTYDVEAELEMGIQDIVSIHVKETKPGTFKCVPFGEGTVRFAEIFTKLYQLGYSGMFLIEMWADPHASVSVEEAADVIRDARIFVVSELIQGGFDLTIQTGQNETDS